jgi:hypothetical protein
MTAAGCSEKWRLYRVSLKYLDKLNIKTKKEFHINTIPEMNALCVSLKDYIQQYIPEKVIFNALK